MDQFKKESVMILARFITFISGSFAAILAIISLLDRALLTDFEITPGGSVLFYIGLFGSIFAAGNSFTQNSNKVLEPETILKQVISETHYFPDDWRDNLHTEKVRNKFSALFEYNILLIIAEIMSLAFGPLIFWFSLPECSESIIDFFKEFTIHVDSLGYVCSFAIFDFKRHGNTKYGCEPVENLKLVSNSGKMEQSFLDFKIHNPDWEPDTHGSLYLNNVLSKRGVEESFFGRKRIPGRANRNLGNVGNRNLAVYSGALDRSIVANQLDPNTSSGVSEGADFFALLDDIYARNREKENQ